MADKIDERGRPTGSGPNSRMIASLEIGDSIIIPLQATPASMLQTARNRFYNPARRLGMKLSYHIENNNIRIKREA